MAAASGLLFPSNPDVRCHFTILPPRTVKVQVKVVYPDMGEEPLSYPSSVRTLGEAIDSWIIWPVQQVQLAPQVRKFNISYLFLIYYLFAIV